MMKNTPDQESELTNLMDNQLPDSVEIVDFEIRNDKKSIKLINLMKSYFKILFFCFYFICIE